MTYIVKRFKTSFNIFLPDMLYTFDASCCSLLFRFLDASCCSLWFRFLDASCSSLLFRFPLRFWVSSITHPNYIFDIRPTPSVESSLGVVGQAFYDACNKSDHQLGWVSNFVR